MMFYQGDVIRDVMFGRWRQAAKVLEERSNPASTTGEWYKIQWEDGSIEYTSGENYKRAPSDYRYLLREAPAPSLLVIGVDMARGESISV